jgi:propanediol dehydratase small subunit
MDKAGESLRTPGGRPLAGVTVEAVAAGELDGERLGIARETLEAQAGIARGAGYAELAGNLARAAELTAVGNEDLLKMYEMMRPGRASFDDLEALAQRLESDHAAPLTAALVREAAAAYRERSLLRREGTS